MLEKSISTPALNWAPPIQKHRIRRSIEDKRKIVLESLSATASIAAVARAYGINANLLHTWRWQYRRGELGEHHSNATLIPVKVSSAFSRPNWTRSPRQTGQRVQSKLIGQSTANWTLIPEQTGHL